MTTYSKLAAVLQRIDNHITADDISDAIWLALEIEKASGAIVPWKNNAVSPVPIEDRQTVDEARSSPTQPTSDQPAPVQTSQASVLQSVNTGLYPDFPQRSGRRGQQLDSMAFRSPTAPALRDSRDIERKLRLFKRRVSRPGKSIVNEEITAKRIAEERIWVPVLENAATRWLDVALVVDKGLSMTIWQQTITEFHYLLAHHGAFRDVRVWEMDTNNAKMVRLYAGAGAIKRNRQMRSELELIDTGRQRLILVITDCVSQAWHSGAVTNVLAKWGCYNSVALVQVLPQKFWSRTSLVMATRIRLHASSPAIPNKQFDTQPIFYSSSEDEEPQSRSSKSIPILTLEPGPFAVWTRVIARAEDLWMPGFRFVISSEAGGDQEYSSDDLFREAIASPLSAAERVQRFHATASDMAWELAGLLAVVPVTLPIIRLIQQTMLPESGQTHVAEVILSGLLEVTSANSITLDPDYVEYEFVDGVQEVLLDTLLPGYTRRVLLEVSDFIASKPGHAIDFRALLANPFVTNTDEVSIDEADRPFAIMAAKALRRFGRAYEALADQLEGVRKDNIPPIPTSIPQQSPPRDRVDSVHNDHPDVFPLSQLEEIIKVDYSSFLPVEKCICPSCFEEIYVGDCRIMSGKTTGKVLKGTPRGMLRRQMARINVEPLDGPRYTRELARRECPKCKYLLPYNIERVKNITLAVVGDTFSGKSHYIASLLHQIKTAWIGNVTGFARLTCLTPDIERIYTRDYFEPLFVNKRIVPATQPQPLDPNAQITMKPLIYELIMRPSSNHVPTVVNLIIYDNAGEDFESLGRLVEFAQFIFHASAFIFVADPVTMIPVFTRLPLPLQDKLRDAYKLKQPETYTRRAADMLDSTINIYDTYHRSPVGGSSLPDTPVAIMVSKTDLLEYLPVPNYEFKTKLRYGNTINLQDVDAVDQKVRGFLRDYEQGDLLTTARIFHRVKYFATSSTGEPPDENGNLTKVEPYRCLDPVLWILYELGVIKAHE